MAYELKDGSGTIFRNKYHEEGDSKPPYKGEVMWRGEKIEIALWVKEGQNAGKYFSVKMQPPRDRPAVQPSRPPQNAPGRRTDMDDEIPFAPEFR